MSKILSWGAVDIYARKYNGSSVGSTWVKFDAAVEGSVSLETTEGDKTEAKVEGGELEAVRRSRSTYALSLQERIGAGFTYAIDDTDGIIDGEWEVVLKPTENATAPAMYIPKATASASDSYSSADGTIHTTKFDALKNTVKVGPSGSQFDAGQVIWGECTITTDAPTAFYAYKDTASSKANLITQPVTNGGGGGGGGTA